MSKARELSQRAGVDGALSNRNKVINGSFLVWQRSDNAYGIASYVSADRFQATRGRIRKPNTNGHSGEDNTGAVFDCTDGDIYVHFDHYIEDIGQKLNGKTMTLSFKAKSLNGSPQDMYLEQSGVDYFDFGTTTISVPTEWTTFTFTGTVVSTGHAGGVHLMRWYLNPTGNALSKMIQIDEVQFEEGDTATPFEHRSIGQELSLCQRFYWQNFDTMCIGRDSTTILAQINFPVEMRATPTAIVLEPNPYYENAAWSQASSLTNMTVNNGHFGPKGGDLLITGTFGVNPSGSVTPKISRDIIAFDAEL